MGYLLQCKIINCLLLLLITLSAVLSENLQDGDTPLSQCREPLGMESGKILDTDITASSSYDLKSVGPHNARIRTDQNGGAWCPDKHIKNDVKEWLQIDLEDLKVITSVETQGRFGGGQGLEYAPEYMLEYQRVEGGKWIQFRDRKGKRTFQGNTNTYSAVSREVNPPIIARKIRFIPFSNHPRTICMRVEVYGCPWDEGVVSYSMRQGEPRGAEVDLYDFTYDGKVQNQHLSGGLGQLIDWDIGETNFRLDTHGTGKRGYQWVGWKNETIGTPPVDIVFQFDTIRNFSKVIIHTNNLFSKDIKVFRLARIYFSVGGNYFNDDPVEFRHLTDDLIEFARNVEIPIPHRIGRAIKLELFFADRWMMISEVRFESVPAIGNFTTEAPPPFISTTDTISMVNPAASPGPGDSHLMEVDIHDNTLTDLSRADTKGSKDNTTGKGETPAHTHPKQVHDTYIGIIIGAIVALILLIILVVVALVMYRKKHKKYGSSSPLKMFVGTDHVNFNLNDLPNGKYSNGNMYKGVSREDVSECEKFTCSTLTKLNNCDVYPAENDIQTRKLPDVPNGCDRNGINGGLASSAFTTPDQYSPLVVNLPPNPVFQNQLNLAKEDTPPPPPPPPHPDARAVCAAIDTLNIQGLTGNSLYAAPNLEILWKEDRNDFQTIELPRQNLKLIEKLGEGQFGEVHLCEASRIADYVGDEFLVNRTNSRPILVAVKMLRPNACEQASSDFKKEIKLMSNLKDPNVVRVLGVCSKEEPLSVVVEYMKYGDLHHFLTQHVPESTIPRTNNVLTLGYGSLIYMAGQIASGMKYLESLNMVHRDLASRNCLVGANYTIKISDFGMSRSLYSNDYYSIQGKAILPIRWMAWESILLGKFSTKSDVWSFAVTLWEILTFARQQPLEQLSDEQVIENCGHYYRNDDLDTCLSQPTNCPKEIYDLMRECWNRDESLRPSFREIHMFLQRKNMGYNPSEEAQIRFMPIA